MASNVGINMPQGHGRSVNLLLGMLNDVTVVNVLSVDIVCLRLCSNPWLASLDEMMSDMTNYYNRFSEPRLLEPILDQDMCAVFHEGFWHRAKVLQYLPHTELFHVLLLDLGHSVLFRKNLLRKLRPVYKQLPYQVIECRLDNLMITNEVRRSVDAKQLVQDIVSEGRFRAYVTGYEQNGYTKIHLYKFHNERTDNVNREIVAKGLAVWRD